jgi:hypothetical protein
MRKCRMACLHRRVHFWGGGGYFALISCNITFLTKRNPWTMSGLIFKMSTVSTNSILRIFRSPCLVTILLLHLRTRLSVRQACWKYRITWTSGGATFIPTPVIWSFFTGAATLCGARPPPWVRNSNFSRCGVVSTTPSPNLEDWGLHFAWLLPFDLSGMSGSTRSLRSHEPSSYHYWMVYTWAYTENISYKCCYAHAYSQSFPRGGGG